MELEFRQQGCATVVKLSGDLDDSAVLTAEQEARLFELFQPGCEITLDLANVRRLTPVGLRQLLLLYRTGTALGTFSFARAPQELIDLVEAAGFLDIGRRSPVARAPAVRTRLRPRADAGGGRIGIVDHASDRIGIAG